MTVDILTPPHSSDAEQGVIGGLLLDCQSDNAQYVLSALKAESFYTRAHQVLFSEIKDMNTKQMTIDGLTLNDHLENKGLLQQVGGFAYLAELTKNTPSAANIRAYAAVVRDNAMRRYGIAKTNAMTELLYANNGMSTTDKFEAIQSLFTEITDVAKTGSKRGARAFGDVFNEWTHVVGQRLEGDSSAIGLTSGIKALDDMLEPKRILRGSLFVVGARPKMGKTTLYLKMAINCAINENLPAIAFSLEMPDQQLVERMICQASGVNSEVFYLDGYDDNKFAMASAKGLMLAKTNNLYIDDTPGVTLAQIVAESRRIKRERGVVGMVLVDYLTLMKAEKADRNDLAYGMITKGLKNLAKELNCVVVLLTQLNRNLEERANKRPLPSDSRDTGQIEQDCDYWLGIYREGAYDEHVSQQDTELLLRLNRHGQSGVVYIEQRHGSIYECNQDDAARKSKERQERGGKKSKGGF